MKNLAIYGAGGFGREVAWLVKSLQGNWDLVCFVDDDPSFVGQIVHNIPVMDLESAVRGFPDVAVVSAIGSPRNREASIEKVKALGLGAVTLVHPETEMSKLVHIGEGTVICCNCTVTVDVEIGRHVHINIHCTIGHDVILQDYATLAPGVHVSGHVHLGKRVYVGTGAVFVNGSKENPIIIGDDTIIGAGAVVTTSLSGGTWVGVPARPLHKGR